jgi:hypothetical protein
MKILRISRNSTAAVAIAAAALFAPSGAHAAFVLLNKDNNEPNIAGQLGVSVTDLGAQVQFQFTNNVGFASSITDIYFDDKSIAVLANPMSLSDSTGVSFSAGASPPNLPGGNTISFSADFRGGFHNYRRLGWLGRPAFPAAAHVGRAPGWDGGIRSQDLPLARLTRGS